MSRRFFFYYYKCNGMVWCAKHLEESGKNIGSLVNYIDGQKHEIAEFAYDNAPLDMLKVLYPYTGGDDA